MRVTENTTMSIVFNNLQVIRQRQELLEQQASTGMKITAPGDDPIGTQQVLGIKNRLAAAEQYTRNIDVGSTWINQMDSAMNEIENTVVRVKEIAMAMANGTYTAAARTNTVSELKELKTQIVQLGNSEIGGKYIFGGHVNNSPPFDLTLVSNPLLPGPPPVDDPRNGTPTGTFLGTDDLIRMEVEQGAYIPLNFSGGKLLRGAATVMGDTTAGSNVIANVPASGDMKVGMTVTGAGIPAGATITAINSTPPSYSIDLSTPATATASGVRVNSLVGVDIVQEIDNLIVAMGTNDVTGIQNAIGTMDTALSQVLTARGEIGARMNRVENARSVLTDMDLNLNSIISQKQDVDFMKVMSELTKQQTAFQATLSASAKVTQMSLLDYLG